MSEPEDTPTVTMPAADLEATVTFTPDWAGDGEPGEGRHAGSVRHRCGCGTSRCPDGPAAESAEKGAMLSCAPGVVTRMSQERVRNGQWEDISACARTAALRVHKPAVDEAARIRQDLEHGVLDLGPVFDRNPALHWDPELAADLARYEAGLADLLARAQVRGWSALPLPAETRAA